jgi:hypothetical protein
MSKTDVEQLQHLQHLNQAQMQLERLKDIEAEIIEREKWNHDASKALLELTLKRGRIPFESRGEGFDFRPTQPEGNVDGRNISAESSAKGKQRAEEQPDRRRAIDQLLPADGKKSWLGKLSKWK